MKSYKMLRLMIGLTSMGLGLGAAWNAGAAVEYHFDFGTAGSPVEAGYVGLTHTSVYAAVPGYGWDSVLGSDNSRDRGAAYDDLRRDLVFSGADHSFLLDLPNGSYQVRVVMFDPDANPPHDLIDVRAEGNLMVDNATAPNTLPAFEATFTVPVSDGQLTLMFHDDGGLDSNWALNAIDIESLPIPEPSSVALLLLGLPTLRILHRKR